MKKVFLLLLFVLPHHLLYPQEYSNQLHSDSTFLNPDYRNRINIPEYNKTLMPLQKVSASSGTWTEVNPKVPRVHYLCIHFVNIDTGWAVGVDGTIIRTVDAGKTWETIKSPVNEILLNVNSYNGKVVLLTGFNGTVLRSENSGLTWEIPQIPDNITSDLWRVEMLNDTLGWIAGKGATLLKTTDAGKSWEKVETGYPNYNYWYVSFYKEKYGYIAGDSGKVLKTKDYGTSWQELNIGDNKSLYTLTVFDSLRVVTGGAFGRVAYTNDGGKSWGLTIGGGLVNAMAFVNDTLGYSIGTFESAYYITRNGGVTWTSTGHGAPLRYGGNWIEFVNDTLGYIAGNYLRINLTTDSGYSWNNLFMNEDIKDIFFINEKIGFAIDDFSVHKTIDGGVKWNRLGGLPYYLKTIYFLDNMRGFLGGQNNEILATVDGGSIWIKRPISGLTDSSFTSIEGFFFVNDSVGYANSSGIYKTDNHGLEWRQIVPFGTLKLFFINPLNGYMFRAEKFYFTSDSGNTWLQRAELPPDNYDDLYFLDSLRGFATGFSRLFFTNDGGFSWQLLSGVNNFYFGSFCWLTQQHAFLLGNRIYETLDSGVSWNDITDNIGTGFAKMHAPSSTIGYGGGELGLILKYEDTTIVSVDAKKEQPIHNLLLNNYPNPFNNSTIIKFISPYSSYGTIKIYNILGEQTEILFSDFIESNKEYKIEMSSNKFSSGIYICRLQTQRMEKTIKIIIIK